MVSIRGDVIRAINPSNRIETKEFTHEYYKNEVDKKIAQIFNVSVEDVKNQEKLIKQPRGFFWDKIVRPLFGYKFDILRVKKSVNRRDLSAFYAAVAKITHEASNEILPSKTLQVSKARFRNHKNELDAIKKELKKEISVEDEIFDKAYEDFLRENDWGVKLSENFQSQFKNEFREFFFNRNESFSKKTKEFFNTFIGEDSSDGKGAYLKDALRADNSIACHYGGLEIIDDSIVYSIKEYSDYSTEKLIALAERMKKGDSVSEQDKKEVEKAKKKCKNNANTLLKNLDDVLKKKNVSDDIKEKFKNFILFLFSQTAEINFLGAQIIENLLGSTIIPENWGITGFKIEKPYLELKVEIIDNKTLKLIIGAKDKETLFTAQKVTFGPSSRLEEWPLAVKNPKSETTFELDEKGQWKVKDGKISFQIEKKAKEAK